MSGGLVALLDDVAAIAKVAASSIDDIGAAASRASIKAVGVVVDDTAVTPRYVTGFTPDRELPIIWKIAKGSLRNKIVFILPVVLLLSQFLEQAISPILMLGGAYLCFEGAEKLYEMVAGHHEESDNEPVALSSQEHENQMVAGAIRTDFILSAEIMAISLSEVSHEPLVSRAIILIVVALLITALVYGVVALIVKMDDIGLKLARGERKGSQVLGRALVAGMPKVLSALSVIGTAAMLWVGGHIIVAGLAKFHVEGPEHLVHTFSHWAEHTIPFATGFFKWLAETVASGAFGLLVGGLIVGLMHLLPKKKAH